MKQIYDWTWVEAQAAATMAEWESCTERPWRGQPQFSLAELFQGKSAAEWRAQYAGAYDWGPDVGREVVDE